MFDSNLRHPFREGFFAAPWLCLVMICLPVWGAAQIKPTPSKTPYTLDQLVHRAQFNNPAIGVARSKLQDYQALLDRASARGLAVPRDLSVSCFASPWVADLELPPTFVEVPERQMAQKAVPIILDQINGKSRANRCYTLSGVFRKGYSTAPA